MFIPVGIHFTHLASMNDPFQVPTLFPELALLNKDEDQAKSNLFSSTLDVQCEHCPAEISVELSFFT